MADFCWDCVQDPHGPGVEGRLNDLSPENPWNRPEPRTEPLLATCEGCGTHWFDPQGRRLPEYVCDTCEEVVTPSVVTPTLICSAGHYGSRENADAFVGQFRPVGRC